MYVLLHMQMKTVQSLNYLFNHNTLHTTCKQSCAYILLSWRIDCSLTEEMGRHYRCEEMLRWPHPDEMEDDSWPERTPMNNSLLYPQLESYAYIICTYTHKLHFSLLVIGGAYHPVAL